MTGGCTGHQEGVGNLNKSLQLTVLYNIVLILQLNEVCCPHTCSSKIAVNNGIIYPECGNTDIIGSEEEFDAVFFFLISSG